MIENKIKKTDALQRIDKYIFKLLPAASKSLIYKQIRKKNITLNRKKISGNEILSEGDTVQFFFSEETYNKFKNETEAGVNNTLISNATTAYEKIKGVDIVYEDDNIVIMNKPQNVLSQMADNNELSLNEWLLGYMLNTNIVCESDIVHFRPSVLNRLDKNTTGMVIGSKTNLGAITISELLRNRNMHKFYLTIVYGKSKYNGIYKAFHQKNSATNTVLIKDTLDINDNPEDYNEIITGIKTLNVLKLNNDIDISVLEIELITGKSHQIRAHLSKLGIPILGDRKYGNKNVNAIIGKKGINTQLLHSYKLVIPSDIPDEISELANKTIVCQPPAIWRKIYGDMEIPWT